VLLGATYCFRPLMVGMAFQQITMWRHGIRRHDVRLGKYRIHFLVAGEGQSLVLVHGLGARSEVWVPLIPQLAAMGFRVYAPDLLGCGHSDKPDVDYSISLQADTLLQFLCIDSLCVSSSFLCKKNHAATTF
jgi:hypothetical protein